MAVGTSHIALLDLDLEGRQRPGRAVADGEQLGVGIPMIEVERFWGSPEVAVDAASGELDVVEELSEPLLGFDRLTSCPALAGAEALSATADSRLERCSTAVAGSH
jgi:hypothetical protein